MSKQPEKNRSVRARETENMTAFSLGELARRTGAELAGTEGIEITGVATLEDAGPGDISFLANDRYRHQLAGTKASAVIVSPEHAEKCQTDALITKNPHLCLARVSSLLNPPARPAPGCHPSAVIAPSAKVDSSAHVGPLSVVGADSVIGPGAEIGPGCVVQENVEIGKDSILVARVTVCARTIIGERCVLHPGAVVGSEGFGLANDDGVWVKVPQLGRVRLGNDVEIGSNTTVDRGSLRDTIIDDGVKLDNLIQIGHNVEVGAHTAMAALSGISGSTTIGKHCLIGGNSGTAGHLEIGDGAYFTGKSMITRSFPEAGSYSSGLPAMPTGAWRRMIGRIRHIDELFQRVRKIEKSLDKKSEDPST